MNSKELRIGNFIMQRDRVVNVNYVTEYTIGYGIDSFDSSYSKLAIFKPIPLTIEWLLNFGLKMNGNNEEWKLTDWHCGEFLEDCFYLMLGNVEYEIKYVHQLQNLYFCLVGEELELKEE